ncbi:MAG: hypothetical protein HC765_08855 [Brachymonas sp.]|nr:hypothetical protein [Brachymonas sp.]
MTDQELKDLVASLAVKSDRLDAQLTTTQAEVAETARVVKEVSRRMGSMASNQGDVAEEFFFNSLSQSKQIGSIHFDDVQQKVYGGKIGAQQEYDLVLLNGDSAAIVEVKYKVHPSSLEQLQKQLDLFKIHFPEHKDMKLYGGVAGFSVPDDVTEQAHANGYSSSNGKAKALQWMRM